MSFETSDLIQARTRGKWRWSLTTEHAICKVNGVLMKSIDFLTLSVSSLLTESRLIDRSRPCSAEIFDRSKSLPVGLYEDYLDSRNFRENIPCTPTEVTTKMETST